MNQTPRKLFGPASAAFSLIEILLVVAVIGLLSMLAIPAMSSMGQARTVTDAGYEIAAAVEMARAEAVARRTFVWLAVESVNTGPDQSLRLGMAFSKDGSNSTTAANVQPIGRPLKIDRIALADSAPGAGDAVNLSGVTGGATFSIGGTSFTGRTLTFTPAGEVTTKASPTSADGFIPSIVIPIRATRGDSQNANIPLDILIDGSVGIPRIQRES